MAASQVSYSGELPLPVRLPRAGAFGSSGAIAASKLSQHRAKRIKTRCVRKLVVFDGAPDDRRYRGELVVGEVNCRHGPGYNRRREGLAACQASQLAAGMLSLTSAPASRRRTISNQRDEAFPYPVAPPLD